MIPILTNPHVNNIIGLYVRNLTSHFEPTMQTRSKAFRALPNDFFNVSVNVSNINNIYSDFSELRYAKDLHQGSVHMSRLRTPCTVYEWRSLRETHSNACIAHKGHFHLNERAHGGGNLRREILDPNSRWCVWHIVSPRFTTELSVPSPAWP